MHGGGFWFFELSGLGTSANTAIENRAIKANRLRAFFMILFSFGSRDFGVNYNSNRQNEND